MSDIDYEEYEQSDPEDNGDNDQEIDIENKYCEADDKRDNNDKSGALAFYLEVITMEEDFVKNHNGNYKYIFASLSQAIIIKTELNDFNGMTDLVKKILANIQTVSTNDSNYKINEIMENFLKHSQA